MPGLFLSGSDPACCPFCTSEHCRGGERNSAAEFKNFLGIAKGSAGELRALIIIAVDLAYLENEQQEILLERCVRISKRIHCLIKSLENRFRLKKRRVVEPG